MKKYEIEHLINLCKTVPVKMSAIVVKDETYKKEILDMIVGCECEFIDNEIRFKNGNVISIIEPKGEHIRGKRADSRIWLDDFEKADSVAVYETLKDVYSAKNVEVVKEKKACHVIEINN